MPSFLAEQVEALRRRGTGDAWKREADWAAAAGEAAEMVALAVHLLTRIEAAANRRQPPEPAGWDEAAARAFVPLFRDWFEYATGVRDFVRACREHGHRVDGVEEFLHGYNRARMMAEDFDLLVESRRRIERGESRGVPLDEVEDELRRRAGVSRAG